MSLGSTIDELLAHQHWENVGSIAGGVEHPTQPTELSVASQCASIKCLGGQTKIKRVGLPAITEAMRRLYGALPRGDRHRLHTRPNQTGEGTYTSGISYDARGRQAHLLIPRRECTEPM